MAFPDDVVERAWRRAGGNCECRRRTHNQLKKKHLGISVNYKHEEGEKLLKDLNSMFNTLSRKYDRNVSSFDVSPKLNVEQLLSDLTEYKQKEKDEFKRQIRQYYKTKRLHGETNHD